MAAAANIGKLTVALGVGAVIAYGGAGVAWADDDAQPADNTSSQSAGPTGAVADDNPRVDTESLSAEKEPAADDEPEVDEAPEEIEPEGTEPEDSEPEDVTPEDTEPSEAPETETVDLPAVEQQDLETKADGDEQPTAVPSSTEDSSPETPVASPALWSLLGSARRDVDPSVTTPATAETSALPTTAETGAETAQPTTVAMVDDVPDWEDLYTGKPSFIHEVVVGALRIVQFVLKPFGGLLRFTSLRIPIFTDGFPPFYPWGMKITRSEFDGMPVWSLKPKDATDDVVVALHGGAYEGEVSIFHWWAYTDMAKDTGATVVVPLYTLAPKGTASTEVPRTADFITKMIDTHGADNVSILGDSAGAGLALSSIQELVRRKSTVPGRLVLMAPWLDASMSDPRSAQIDDPLLDIPNLARAGKAWAGALDPADPLVSPLFGSLQGLPPTSVYSSSRDLLTVDTLRLRDRVLAEGIPNVTFTLRKGLIHDYFTFPFLPDAHAERVNVYNDLLGTNESPLTRLVTVSECSQSGLAQQSACTDGTLVDSRPQYGLPRGVTAS